MLFNSVAYVVFLWSVFVVFWTLRAHRRARYVVLLGASYWFYGQAHWAYTGLLATSTLVDFVAGARIHVARARGDARTARRWLWLSLGVNLGLLAVFKYFDFFSGSVEAALRDLGFDASTWRLDLVLPVGISFYTFQTLSYTIDVHRGRLEPTASLLEFAVYVSFFPQLVAGPIVRAIDFLPQMARPTAPDRVRVGEGVFLILQGLTKKLVVADMIGSRVVDPAFADAAGLEQLGAGGVLLLGLGFLLQVYGDFSGYSDIAIGSARLLGFALRPNFAMPFMATSLDEFWRRWHISMTTWFRDYVYVGLGGNRRGLTRTCVNICVTVVLVGLWHGASWNFVVFGVVHGLGLIALLLFRLACPERPFRRAAWWVGLGWLATFLFADLTILFYRCPDLETWWRLVSQLGDWSGVGLEVSTPIALIAVASFVAHALPQRWCDTTQRAYARAPALVQAALVVGLALALFGIRPPGDVPFYYFQF